MVNVGDAATGITNAMKGALARAQTAYEKMDQPKDLANVVDRAVKIIIGFELDDDAYKKTFDMIKRMSCARLYQKLQN